MVAASHGHYSAVVAISSTAPASTQEEEAVSGNQHVFYFASSRASNMICDLRTMHSCMQQCSLFNAMQCNAMQCNETDKLRAHHDGPALLKSPSPPPFPFQTRMSSQRFGMRALGMAASLGHTDIVEYLIKQPQASLDAV